MRHPLLELELATDRDMIAARQRARQLSALLEFDAQDQVRIATAVSEVARNAVRHGGGGRIGLGAITTISFEGDVTTAGGEQGGSGTAERGSGGTIDWPANSDLTIGGAGNFNSVTMGYDGSNSYNFDALTINTGGVLTVDGDPTVNAGAGGGVTITATTVAIETGGLMNANALGFVNTRGSGAGTNALKGSSAAATLT